MWLQDNALEVDPGEPLCIEQPNKDSIGRMSLDELPETKMTADAAKQRILHQPHLAMQRLWWPVRWM